MDILVEGPLRHSGVDGLEGEVVSVGRDLAVEDVEHLDVELLAPAIAARSNPE